MVLFGGGDQITILSGCEFIMKPTVWIFNRIEQSSRQPELAWFADFTGVCTIVQERIMLCFGKRYDQTECYQVKFAFTGKTDEPVFESFEKMTDSLYLHGHGTKIASINGN